jgi:hypothetical protein
MLNETQNGNPIEEAVRPLKQDAQDRAAKYAQEVIDQVYAKRWQKLKSAYRAQCLAQRSANMATVIYPKLRTTRERHKQVPATFAPGVQGHGVTSVPDGMEEVIYEVSLDFDAVACMARRAAKSRGQKSVDGPLTVKVLKRTRL